MDTLCVGRVLPGLLEAPAPLPTSRSWRVLCLAGPARAGRVLSGLLGAASPGVPRAPGLPRPQGAQLSLYSCPQGPCIAVLV